MSSSHPSRSARAFSLLEVIIIITVITMVASLVVPQFSDAAKVGRESTLRDDLLYLRSQVLVYRAQHNQVSPGYPDGNRSRVPNFETFLAQMTSYTDAAGRVSKVPSATYKYGPYLKSIPFNVVNGSSEIRVVGQADFPGQPQGNEGWIYQPSSATVVANVAGHDAAGVRLFDY